MKPTPELLKQTFDAPEMTVIKASKLFAVNEKTIRRWLKAYGLKTRPMSETASLRQSASSNISVRGEEILIGELLGDGSLSCRSPVSARYSHTSKHRKYLSWLKEKMSKEGIVFGQTSICTANKDKYTGYALRSRSQIELKPFYDLFYPNRKKIVPSSLRLTPRICLHWYLGDGHKPKNRKHLLLFPLSFHISSVKSLADQLLEFNPVIRKQYKAIGEDYGYAIALSLSFIDYIGGCPEGLSSIYGYKFK